MPEKSRLRLLSLENRIAPAGFAVNTLADSGAGSLRAAITSANGSAGADTITFALPGSGGTISLLSALPAITEALTIDGTTQSGYVGVPRVTIDGTSAGAGVDGLNFSAGNASTVKGLALVGFSGVAIHGTASVGAARPLTILSSYIGILADGKTAKANGVGIRLEFNDNSVVGAASTGLGNLVSGNGTGIVLRGWNCIVQGNRIGTDVTGTVAVPNATGLLDIGLNNIIGGSNAGEGNLISGNTSVGLNMQLVGYSTVQGNHIGTDITGNVALSNGIGISVGKASLTENYGSFVIGGANAGNANTIAFNGTGIVLLGGARDVGIIGNSIFQNTALGIDLSGAGSPDGPSLNGGAGANNMIRPPVLTSVTTSGANSTITGTLTGNANQRYRLEFFSNASANASGYGEGKTFLGFINVTTNASGQASFSTTVGAVSTNSFVAATATMTNVGDDLTTNATPTSEFSRAVRQSNAIFATAAGPGGGPHVVARNADGSIRFQMYAYAATYTGGVRVATGDVNGDGVEDLITAPGVGGGPHIRIFDGKNGQVIGEFFAYASNFTKGVFVAAGDINGDGTAEIITGAGAGGGPHVRVFSLNGTLVREFFAYSASFLGGVNVASGDVNGDGKSDIITGVGPGGGPHVRVFSGLDNSVLTEFFAYSAAFTGGVNVAAGDFNGDGKADIIVGAGSGGGPHVRVLSGANLAELASFFAYSSSFTGGVRVAADDVNGDGFADLITAPGPGIASQIKVLQGTSLNTLQSFNAYDPSFLGGVYVG